MPRVLQPTPLVGGPADGECVQTARRVAWWAQLGDGFEAPVWHQYVLEAGDEGFVFRYAGIVSDEGPDTP